MSTIDQLAKERDKLSAELKQAKAKLKKAKLRMGALTAVRDHALQTVDRANAANVRARAMICNAAGIPHDADILEWIAATRVRIVRLEKAGSWRSIDTAPHDRNWVLGYDSKDGETGMIIFDQPHDDNDDSEWEWTDGMRRWKPTHWMPIPEPPEAKEAKP